MSSPPTPYKVGNVYYTHFQTRVGPTHPNYLGTYTPPAIYNVTNVYDAQPKGNIIQMDKD